MKHTLRHLLILLAVTLFVAPATHAQELVRVEKNGLADKSQQAPEKFIAVRDGLKFGFVDKLGKILIPCMYDFAWDSSEGLARVRLYGKVGFIDRMGNEAIPCKYDDAKDFTEGLAAVKKNGLWGFVDKNGEIKIPFRYYDVSEFSEGLAPIKRNFNSAWGYLNREGDIVIPCKYGYAYSFSEGLAAVKQYRGGWEFIDKAGCTIIPCTYNEVRPFSEGLAGVTIGGRIGYIDKNGNVVIPCKYKFALSFSEGIASVCKNKKWELIDKNGNTILSVKDLALPFSNGLAEVFAREIHYIDHKGNKYKTVQEGLAAIAANPLLAQHEGYSGEDKVTIAQNKEAAPAPQTPVAQPKSQPTPQPVTQPIAQPKQQPKPQPQPAPQPQVEAPVYASVDADIPQGKVLNDKTFVVIVANENYRREQGVEFALNDGEVFKRYCERTLGIPTEQIHLIPDATLNDLHAEVDWLCEVANTYEGEAKILFYYVGHGLPDESTRKAYLLPTDGYGSNVVKTGYPLQELYDRLSSIPTRQSLVLLDACFSGGQRDGKMMVSARGIAIAPEDDAPKNNLIVFSATQGDRMAYNYREMKHGMFTYYLLKKLQETKGHVTFGELTDYVKREVERRSIVVNRKKQTPTVMVGDGLTHTWQQISLR